MGKEWCVDGQLVATSYNSPVPLIGLYIAIATMVCLYLITGDTVIGFFNLNITIPKKPFWPPCRFFTLNAFTITLLAVATKIPNDLVTQMPRAEDQLSKLTATALLCTSFGVFMPSLGTMGSSEQYQNLGALTLMVITVVVNVCIQMHTGVIFAFKIEHIIIMVCLVVLLVVMWLSPRALREQRNYSKRYVDGVILPLYRKKVKDLDGLWGLIKSAFRIKYQNDGQTLLCKSRNHYTIGLLCLISLVVVLESMLRYRFAPTSRESCGTTASDYKWSIHIVIWTQFVTIVVGSVPIIRRWFSLLRHVDKVSLEVSSQLLESEDPEPLCFQILPPEIHWWFREFFGVMIYLINNLCFILAFAVKRFLECITHCRTTPEEEEPTDKWIDDMVVKEMEIYRCKVDRPKKLIDLISKYPGISSECADFTANFEETGKEINGDYRVSFVSVLVFSGIIRELLPSSPRKYAIMWSLKQSFEIIHFVHRKTHTYDMDNPKTWELTYWRNWEEYFDKWLRTMIISGKNEGFSLKQVVDLGVLKDTLEAIGTYFEGHRQRASGDSSTTWYRDLFSNEFEIICKSICKFIPEEMSERAEALVDFLEKISVKMLCSVLSSLPLAILKEMEGDPNEISERTIRRAFNFCSTIECLLEKMEFSWPPTDGHSDASSAATDAPAVTSQFEPHEIVTE